MRTLRDFTEQKYDYNDYIDWLANSNDSEGLASIAEDLSSNNWRSFATNFARVHLLNNDFLPEDAWIQLFACVQKNRQNVMVPRFRLHNGSEKLFKAVMTGSSRYVENRPEVVAHPRCPENIISRCTAYNRYDICQAILQNPNCPEKVLIRLSKRKLADELRDMMIEHKNFPEDLRARFLLEQ